MVRWIQSWLANRLAWVKVDGVRSEKRCFQQGLPQGSVLSPLLFLVYINDLVEELAESVQVSAFADDLAVWESSKKVQMCSEKVEWAAEVVCRWSDEWLMKVTVEKCSATLFSMDVKDATMEQLVVRMRGQVLKRELRPVFLGVMFDSKMVFHGQVERVIKKAEVGVRLMGKLAGKIWGWRKDLLKMTYLALVRSILLYGSAAWAPWVSKTEWEKVERVQLKAARIISGVLRSSPSDAVLAEAGLSSVKNVAESRWVSQMELCMSGGR